MSLTARILSWAKRKHHDELTNRYGGTQTCPWCRQCAQSDGEWGFKAWEENPMLDVLTCGVCGGTSIWLWGMGMHWMAALNPPAPAWPDHVSFHRKDTPA